MFFLSPWLSLKCQAQQNTATIIWNDLGNRRIQIDVFFFVNHVDLQSLNSRGSLVPPQAVLMWLYEFAA